MDERVARHAHRTTRLAALALVGVVGIALSAGCSRHAGGGADAGAAPASSAASSASAVAPAPSGAAPKAAVAHEPLEPARVPVEPSRRALARLDDDPDLAEHAEKIRAHFGGDVPSPLAVQTATLDGPRTAWLLQGAGDDPNPMVLVADEHGALVFDNDRPLVGIVPGARELALAPAAEGAVSLVFYDPPSHTLAVRTWRADGTVLADHVLLELEACDAVSALRWPDHGLVVVASRAGGARAQRLADDGLLAWGRDGVAVPTAWRAPAPVSLALDTAGSLVMVHHGHARGASGPGAADHLVAERFDPTGAMLWPKPLDLGPVARVTASSERVRLESESRGALRVLLETPKASRGPRAIELASDGTATRR
jgi:hypothetical protein